MKITAINGSPRGSKSRTHLLVEDVFRGAVEKGAETEEVLLVKKKIKHCLGCFNCFVKTPGKCVIKDDMAELHETFMNSDVVLFATPLYVDNVSGLMKNFMDRLIPLVQPFVEPDEKGESRHVKRYPGYPKIGIISNAGFPEQSQFQVLRLLIKRIARNLHTDVVFEVYRGGGMLIGHDMPMLQPILQGYSSLLQKAGGELVEAGGLSEQTVADLEKNLILDELYIQKANERFEREIKELSQEDG